MIPDTLRPMVRNWKTSAFALISAAAGFIALHPIAGHAFINNLASYITLGGFVGFGIVAQDASKPK